TATRTRYIPLAFLHVAAETPVSDHGDTDERPSPPPKAKRASDSAAAATAPAAMLAQHRAGGSCTTTTVSAAREMASMDCYSGHCRPKINYWSAKKFPQPEAVKSVSLSEQRKAELLLSKLPRNLNRSEKFPKSASDERE